MFMLAICNTHFLPQIGQEEAAAQEIIVTFVLSPHPYLCGDSKNYVRMK
jgi:hypothetical protein